MQIICYHSEPKTKQQLKRFYYCGSIGVPNNNKYLNINDMPPGTDVRVYYAINPPF